jgi:RNA ligase (TIGR02306 family)
MSESPQVEILRISKVEPHPNADRLDLITVLGWRCVVGRGSYRAGDAVVYFPVDTLVPEKVQAVLQGDSKVKVGNRIKAAKIRQIYSEGMVAPINDFPTVITQRVGTDVSELLGCTKHDPDANLPEVLRINGGKAKPAKDRNMEFPRYTKFTHVARSAFLFDPEDAVVVTEKLHGTSARYGRVASTGFLRRLWEAARRLVDRSFRPGTFFVGSRNVDFAQTGRPQRAGHAFYGTNVYVKTAEKYDLQAKVRLGEVVYGEIVGPGIQKGWEYTPTLTFWVYDVSINGRFLDDNELDNYCSERGLNRVPVLDRGRYADFEGKLDMFGTSTFPNTICEGVVIRTQKETVVAGQRALAKFVRPEYRIANDKAGGSEWH